MSTKDIARKFVIIVSFVVFLGAGFLTVSKFTARDADAWGCCSCTCIGGGASSLLSTTTTAIIEEFHRWAIVQSFSFDSCIGREEMLLQTGIMDYVLRTVYVYNLSEAICEALAGPSGITENLNIYIDGWPLFYIWGVDGSSGSALYESPFIDFLGQFSSLQPNSPEWDLENFAMDHGVKHAVVVFLSSLWYDRMLPAFQNMGSQLVTLNADQSRTVATLFDAANFMRLLYAYEDDRLQSHREQRIGDNTVVVGTITGGLGRANSFKKAWNAALPVANSQRTANHKDAVSSGGVGADTEDRWKRYVTNYCRAEDNNAAPGCDEDQTYVDWDLDVAGTIFAHETIDVRDAQIKQAVDDLIANIADPFINNPVSPTAVTGATRQEVVLERESYKAKRQVIYDALYHVVGRRAPGGKIGSYTQEIREEAGVNSALISDNPSYNEIMHVLINERTRSGKYGLEQVDEPEANRRELIIQQALQLIQWHDQVDLMDRLALLLAADIGENVKRAKATSAGGGGISTVIISTSKKYISIFMVVVPAVAALFFFGNVTKSWAQAFDVGQCDCCPGCIYPTDTSLTKEGLIKGLDAALVSSITDIQYEFPEIYGSNTNDILNYNVLGTPAVSIEEFEQNLAAFWEMNWQTNMLPAFQNMTEQFVTIFADQARHFQSMLDASDELMFKLDNELTMLSDYRDNMVKDNVTVTATLSGGYGRASAFSKAITKSMQDQNLAIGLSSKDTAGAGGYGAAERLRYNDYFTLFCNPESNGGIALCRDSDPDYYDADVHLTQNIYNKLTIPINSSVDTEGKMATTVNAIITNLVGSVSADPIPAAALQSPAGQEQYLNRRAYLARYAAARSVPNTVVGWRTPGSGAGQWVKELRQDAGVPESEIADNPSYREVIHALTVDRFNSGKYAAGVITDKSEIEMEKLILDSVYLMQLRNYYELLERTALVLAVQVSVMADEISAADASGTGALSTSEEE